MAIGLSHYGDSMPFLANIRTLYLSIWDYFWREAA